MTTPIFKENGSVDVDLLRDETKRMAAEKKAKEERRAIQDHITLLNDIINERDWFHSDRLIGVVVHIKDFVLNDDPNFYVIGTFDADERTIAHETRHANYYLDREYRQTCDDIFKELPESVKDAVTLRLLEMGYSDTVIPDETQAYFGTESPASLKVLFNLSESPKGWADKFKNVRP